MLQGAIFDLDGTILDSMSLWDGLAEAYLRSVGCVPLPDVNDAVRALSLFQAARYFQREYGLTRSEEAIMDDVRSMIARFYEQEAAAKPGAAAFLEALSRQGIRLCLATATDVRLARAALERLGLARLFSGVFTTQPGLEKDKPEIYRRALAHLGTEKRRTAVFEDAVYALRTAKADGFPTVAVYDRSEPDPAQARALADCCLNDYRDTKAFWAFARGR